MDLTATTLRPFWDGARLRALREGAGLSRDDLSRAIGATSQVIKLWEIYDERYSPSPAMYRRLWEFFDCGAWHLAPLDPDRRRLDDYRLRAGFTMKDMVKHFGSDHRTLKAIESGRTQPDMETAEEWASMLGLSLTAWMQLHNRQEEPILT